MNEFENPMQSQEQAMASRPISRFVGAKETMRRANQGVNANPAIRRPAIRPPMPGGPQPATTGMPGQPIQRANTAYDQAQAQAQAQAQKAQAASANAPQGAISHMVGNLGSAFGGINPGNGAVRPSPIGGMPRIPQRPMPSRVSLADDFNAI